VLDEKSGQKFLRITKLVGNGSLDRDGRVKEGYRITHIFGQNIEEWNVNKILDEIVGPSEI